MKLKVKLLLVSIVPILITSLVIGIYVSNKATASMKEEIKDALHSTCYMLRDDSAEVEGNNYYVENDMLYNGERNLTEETELIDLVKSETGIVSTIFYGNTRYVTSVVQDDGKRALLTTAGDAVVTKVITNKQEYFAENVNVVGKPYFAYYIPLIDDDGNAVTNKNINGKYSFYQNGKLFSVPFITLDGRETFQARKKDVDWSKMHLNGKKIY